MSLFGFSDLKKKFMDLLYDVSVGLVKDYQKTAVDIAKIEAATFYVKTVRAVRQQCFLMTLVIFGLLVYANALAIFQVALLLYAPWPVSGKIASAALIGVLGFIAPLIFILRFFSEKRWMQVTKADACVAAAVERNGS